ncbi:MAG: OadG family protein [Spirochaetaceae bacterium]|jgi:oxaloacetate decarboxylase gamma subunit|nr:OadG family protein [Spirochaetaceae bacterium]
MTIGEMFEQSAILTVLGMTVVFAFIWLMIICVNGFARLVHKIGLDKDTPEKGAGGAVAPEVITAISAAVTEYRKQGGMTI